MSELTWLLAEVECGEPSAAERLWRCVYGELHRLAVERLARERPDQTLQATALVHEAYLRLVDAERAAHWNSRGHFFAAAAEAMRRILVDRARARLAQKRGGGADRVELPWDRVASRYTDAQLLDVDDLLADLAEVDAVAAQLVQLHVFGGFSMEEAGAVLGLSRATAYRNWAFARAWLRRALTSR